MVTNLRWLGIVGGGLLFGYGLLLTITSLFWLMAFDPAKQQIGFAGLEAGLILLLPGTIGLYGASNKGQLSGAGGIIQLFAGTAGLWTLWFSFSYELNFKSSLFSVAFVLLIISGAVSVLKTKGHNLG